MALLPPGFDPATGKLRTGAIPTSVITNPPSSSSYGSYSPGQYSRRRGPWTWFNDTIIAIGNWIADVMENLSNVAMWVTIIGIVLSALIGIISIFAEGRVFMGIVAIIFGGGLLYYLMFLIAAIVKLVVSLVLYVVRFIFWNGWTFILAAAVIAGISIATAYVEPDSYNRNKVESSTEYSTTYVCTANVLNVRSAPSTSASVLGVLRKGDRCQVLSRHGSFSKIKYNGSYGYVSSSYLQLQ